jgi:hypothetical protein
MGRSHSRRFKMIRAARVLLAAVLLSAFLSGIVPLAAVTAGSLCTLECCVGRAPHASGSCMNGSCQVTLPSARKHSHHAAPDRAENFCGLPREIHLTNVTLNRAKSRLPSSSDHLSPLALENPCQPDCGGCASGFANSNRSRNSAAVAVDNRPRPPTNSRLSNFRYHRTRVFNAQCRQGSPRGPPSAGF